MQLVSCNLNFYTLYRFCLNEIGRLTQEKMINWSKYHLLNRDFLNNLLILNTSRLNNYQSMLLAAGVKRRTTL